MSARNVLSGSTSASHARAHATAAISLVGPFTTKVTSTPSRYGGPGVGLVAQRVWVPATVGLIKHSGGWWHQPGPDVALWEAVLRPTSNLGAPSRHRLVTGKAMRRDG